MTLFTQQASLGIGYYNSSNSGGNYGHSMPSTNIHNGSHPGTGYSTPNDVSGLLTPDLDLPLDFGAFDDFPVTDSLHGFASHPPSVATPHTHHYTAQPSHQSQLQQHHPSHPPIQPSHGKCIKDVCNGQQIINRNCASKDKFYLKNTSNNYLVYCQYVR